MQSIQKQCALFHPQYFLDQGLYENYFGTKNLLVIHFYNFIAESNFRIVLVVKLRSGGLQRPYSIRLKYPDIKNRPEYDFSLEKT